MKAQEDKHGETQRHIAGALGGRNESKWERHAIIESSVKGLVNYVKALELSEEQEEVMMSFVF